jgi:hypothetical protein
MRATLDQVRQRWEQAAETARLAGNHVNEVWRELQTAQAAVIAAEGVLRPLAWTVEAMGSSQLALTAMLTPAVRAQLDEIWPDMEDCWPGLWLRPGVKLEAADGDQLTIRIGEVESDDPRVEELVVTRAQACANLLELELTISVPQLQQAVQEQRQRLVDEEALLTQLQAELRLPP